MVAQPRASIAAGLSCPDQQALGVASGLAEWGRAPQLSQDASAVRRGEGVVRRPTGALGLVPPAALDGQKLLRRRHVQSAVERWRSLNRVRLVLVVFLGRWRYVLAHFRGSTKIDTEIVKEVVGRQINRLHGCIR